MIGRLRAILNRPSILLYVLCFLFAGSVHWANRVADLYRDGTRISWHVAGVHIIAVIVISAFFWLFERLNNRLSWAQRTGDKLAAYKARKAQEVKRP